MKKADGRLILENKEKLQAVITNLARNGIDIFEYIPSEDTFILYASNAEDTVVKTNFLTQLKTCSFIHPEDLWKMEEICKGHLKHQTEIRFLMPNQGLITRILDADVFLSAEKNSLLGTIRNITEEQKREKILEEQVKRDSLTGLYNHFFGKELINEYLINKTPYASCGMMVVDIDYFKSANDVFGHLFGDTVLRKISELFQTLFNKKDILIRAGGDEFVIFLKDISHPMMLKKAGELVNSVRDLTFSEQKYSMTCSVGVCFLPENISGYTYEQLFENADWALYRAKENGKNRYEFCDNLKRYELLSDRSTNRINTDIEPRYLQNDIISTAFEVFEKMNSFTAAIELLMKIIGTRFGLDRITIYRLTLKPRKQAVSTSGLPLIPHRLCLPLEVLQKKTFLLCFKAMMNTELPSCSMTTCLCIHRMPRIF